MGVMQPADLALFLGAVVVLLAAFAARIGTRLGLPALLPVSYTHLTLPTSDLV